MAAAWRRQLWCVCSLAWLIAGGSHAQPNARAQPADEIYAYTDDRGRLVYAQRLSDVPAALRTYARRVDAPDASADRLDALTDTFFSWTESKQPDAQPRESVIYRYDTPHGRTVFTNIPDSVPQAQRHLGPLDLAKISLNTQLGRDLDQRLKQRYDSALQSPYCSAARARVAQPWWQALWQEHRELVLLGAAALVLLLLTPRMTEWVGGAPWAKALSTGFSMLGLAALIAFSYGQSKRTLGQIEQQAEPCDGRAWSTAAQSEQPLTKHLQLVRRLELQTRALEQVHAEAQL